ncbi:MAG: methyltransferase domain-containing protein [Pseudomonadota bacterium]
MDIFGTALAAYLGGVRDREITIRRDDDSVDGHSPGLYFAEAPFPHEVAALARVEAPVLDVGCGAGRHLLWLQRQGLEAVGFDISPGAVEVCRARGCADVRCLDVLAGADLPEVGTALLFGNNIGLGGTRERTVKLLRILRGAVRPGGRIVLTALDIAATQDPTHLAYHRRNAARGRPRGEIRIRLEYHGQVGPWFGWHHPEPGELRTLAAESGWAVDTLEPAGPFYWAVLR